MTEEINTYEVVPEIAEGIETIFNDDGLITIAYPRYKKQWQIKYLLPKKRKNEIKLDFDVYGSAVWKLIDGKRNVRQILVELEDTSKEQEQFPQRVVKFLQGLLQNDFIKVK